MVSSVVAGGAIFLITYPGTESIQAWRLARIGQRRFRAIGAFVVVVMVFERVSLLTCLRVFAVAPADERDKVVTAVAPGTAESR